VPIPAGSRGCIDGTFVVSGLLMSVAAGSGTLTIDCRECGASLAVAPELRTAQCPYCASTSVVERPPSRDRPAPAFVVGFVLDRAHAEQALRRWTASCWFAHPGFRRASIDAMRGVYVPAYLYGAVARAEYEAQIGEHYTEVQTYTTTVNGRTVTRTRTVTKTEWRHLSGSYAGYVRDVVVTASKGVPNDELQAIEPYELRALRRYNPGLLSGWIAEEPSRTFEECVKLAHEETVAALGAKLDKFMPGDSHSNLTYRPTLEHHVVDLLLLPVWACAVRYAPDKPALRILLNGQTGKAAGKVPRSWWKIAGTIGVGLGLAALLAWWLGAFGA
jgi:hypothetical protein